MVLRSRPGAELPCLTMKRFLKDPAAARGPPLCSNSACRKHGRDVCVALFFPLNERSTLLAAIAGMGGIPVDLGIVKDKESTLK